MNIISLPKRIAARTQVLKKKDNSMIRFMDRKFLPVGQGAFYCERFMTPGRTINIVYDCGTFSGMDVFQRELDREFNQDDIIDAVFISHLHEDHFNGLERLSHRCKIQRIYLPHIEPLYLKLTQLDYVIRNPIPPDNNTQDLVNRVLGDETMMDDNGLKEILQPLCREVNDGEGGAESDSYYHINNHDTITAEQKGPIFVHDSQPSIVSRIGPSLGHQGLSSYDSWHFKAFCIKNHEVIKMINGKLKKFIEDELRKVNKLVEDDNLPNQIAKLIREIKSKYGVPKNGQPAHGQPTESANKFLKRIRSKVYDMFLNEELNANSLVLYSGCDIRSGLAVVRRPMCCSVKAAHGNMCCHPVGKVGCLYTGDFDAKAHWDNLYDGLTLEEWQTIGCIQIPHHGSERSFNEKFLDNNPFPGPATCHVISAGLGNGYKHPSESVIKMYNQRHCFPIVVTQDPGSLAEWRIQKPECVPWPRYYYDLPEYWTMRFYRGLYP